MGPTVDERRFRCTCDSQQGSAFLFDGEVLTLGEV